MYKLTILLATLVLSQNIIAADKFSCKLDSTVAYSGTFIGTLERWSQDEYLLDYQLKAKMNCNHHGNCLYELDADAKGLRNRTSYRPTKNLDYNQFILPMSVSNSKLSRSRVFQVLMPKDPAETFMIPNADWNADSKSFGWVEWSPNGKRLATAIGAMAPSGSVLLLSLLKTSARASLPRSWPSYR